MGVEKARILGENVPKKTKKQDKNRIEKQNRKGDQKNGLVKKERKYVVWMLA